jgi:hypothetical protein
MRQLAVWCARLLPTFVLAALMARFLGAAGPSTAQMLFTDAEGVPCVGLCLLGARPGEDSLEAAVQRIRRHPLLIGHIVNDRTATQVVELIAPDVAVILWGDRLGKLAGVSLRFETAAGRILTPAEITRLRNAPSLVGARLSVGDMMALFGAPPKVQIGYRGQGTVRMFFPTEGVLITGLMTAQRGGYSLPGAGPRYDIAPTDRLSYFAVSAPDWFREAWGAALLSASGWHGFGTADGYARARIP